MSLRIRWRTARTTSPDTGAAGIDVFGADAWWAALPSGPAIAALLDLATGGATGALEFPETPGAAVYLVDGAVTQVTSPTVPDLNARLLRRRPAPAEAGGRGLWVRVVVADVVADAALDTLTGAAPGRFVPGRRHRAPLERPLRAGALLDETARRRRVLAALAHQARPDGPVHRAERLPADRIRLTARQWDLVRLADGRTPRTMARELAAGMFRTTVEVATLVQADVLTTESDEPQEHPTMPFLRAVSGP